MIFDLVLGDKHILILGTLPSTTFFGRRLDLEKKIVQVVSSARPIYDAVLILESANIETSAITPVYRKLIKEYNFKPIRPTDGITNSYWLLETGRRS